MIKLISKYISAYDYVNKTILVLLDVSSGICITTFVNVIVALLGIASSVLVSLVFLFSTGLLFF